MEVLKDVSFSLSGENMSQLLADQEVVNQLYSISSLLWIRILKENSCWMELVYVIDQKQLAAIRNEKIGFVFQFHYLLNEFTTLKNVMLPGFKLDKVK